MLIKLIEAEGNERKLSMKRYIEFSFYLPFFDLIDETDEIFNLEEIMRQLDISFNKMELYKQYLSILYNIHSGAEIKSKTKESHDDLLKLEINSEDYPKEIRYGDRKYIKNIYYDAL